MDISVVVRGMFGKNVFKVNYHYNGYW